MSLFPGGRRETSLGVFDYSLDDSALVDSMALAMEEEMAAVYQGLKKTPLPPMARQDMRLLFVAIARGMLRYLKQNETGNITAKVSGIPQPVDFSVDMDKP